MLKFKMLVAINNIIFGLNSGNTLLTSDLRVMTSNRNLSDYIAYLVALKDKIC